MKKMLKSIRIRSIIIAIITIMLLTLVFAAEANARGRNKYAAVCIKNNLKTNVYFSYQWGNGMSRGYGIPAGYSTTFTHKYEKGSQSSPTFHLKLKTKGITKNYELKRYASPNKECAGAYRYHFFKTSKGQVAIYDDIKNKSCSYSPGSGNTHHNKKHHNKKPNAKYIRQLKRNWNTVIVRDGHKAHWDSGDYRLAASFTLKGSGHLVVNGTAVTAAILTGFRGRIKIHFDYVGIVFSEQLGVGRSQGVNKRKWQKTLSQDQMITILKAGKKGRVILERVS